MEQTGSKRYERKLVALLAADVAGFSRQIEADEVGTLRALEVHREVMDRLIAEHGGRIANTAGDSVLAEFASAVNAVECAVEVQQHLSSDLGCTKLQFRIGVHVGDAVVRGMTFSAMASTLLLAWKRLPNPEASASPVPHTST